MPTGDICVANIGTPVPVSYGFFRATGMRKIDFTVPSGAGSFPGMQIGFWDLGEGELDGADALWIGGDLQFAYDSSGTLMTSKVGITPGDPTTQPTLNFWAFHSGCDAPVGASPGYSATQQWLDPLWQYIGSLVTPLCYSRRAYYAIGWTPPSSGSSTLAPIGDFRGMRCRIFDSYGTQIGYRFTTNPWWHWVDAWLRRAIKPEYAIDPDTGPTPLTADEASCFDWPSIAAAAAYCDELLANGQPRFSGSYVFTGGTLGAWEEQMLLTCRGYRYEHGGKLFAYCDQPRDSVFHVTAKHLAPGSISGDQSQVNQAGNRFLGSFLEIGLPAVSEIATIARTSSEVTIDTVNPNPMAVGDLVSVGGVDDDSFDAVYNISTISSVTEAKAAIYSGVAASSAHGWIGYMQSRFSRRVPEITHQQHQRAQGQVLPPSSAGVRTKRTKVSYDFGSMTYDQANRLLKYEVYRELGIDYLNPTLVQALFGDLTKLGSAYQPPFQFTIFLWAESVDANMQAIKDKLPGSIITLDETVMFELAGDYEIIDRWINPIQQELQDLVDGSFISQLPRSGSLVRGTDQNSGILKLLIRTYNPQVFFDVSDAPSASFQTVPGQLPFGGTGSSSSSGWKVVSGTLTVSTPYAFGALAPANSTASWSNIVIRLGSGVVLSYPADSVTGLNSPPGDEDLSYFLYIDDPTFGGGPGCVGVGSAYPTAGPGVFDLNEFACPSPPPSSGSTVTYTTPIRAGR